MKPHIKKIIIASLLLFCVLMIIHIMRKHNKTYYNSEDDEQVVASSLSFGGFISSLGNAVESFTPSGLETVIGKGVQHGNLFVKYKPTKPLWFIELKSET